MRLNGHNGNDKVNGEAPDMSAYDKIRAQNTANDPQEGELASASASCNLPGQDYPKKAYGQLRQFQEGPGGEGHDHATPVQLINIKLPKRPKIEVKTKAD